MKNLRLISVQDLIDWKLEVWDRQFNVDYRIQALFNSLDNERRIISMKQLF